MSSNRLLSDNGLIRGSITVTIDGVPYLLKTFDRAKPVRSDREYDASGLPLASSHAADFQTISVEIMAEAGVQEPSQLVPFSYDGKLWALGNLNLRGTTEGLTSYSGEITQLASATTATITTTA